MEKKYIDQINEILLHSRQVKEQLSDILAWQGCGGNIILGQSLCQLRDEKITQLINELESLSSQIKES